MNLKKGVFSGRVSSMDFEKGGVFQERQPPRIKKMLFLSHTHVLNEKQSTNNETVHSKKKDMDSPCFYKKRGIF